MKTFKFALALAALAAFVFAGAAGADCGKCGHGKEIGQGHGKGHGACMAKASDCPGYDKSAMTTFKGTVVSINKEDCEGCGMTHVDLVIKIEDGERTVRLGPAWYLDKQDELLKADDAVEIVASKVKHGDEDMFVAGTVKKGEDVLILRNEDGIPMWRGWRRGV